MKLEMTAARTWISLRHPMRLMVATTILLRRLSPRGPRDLVLRHTEVVPLQELL